MSCGLDLWKDRNIKWWVRYLAAAFSKIFAIYLLRMLLASLASIIIRKCNNLRTITVSFSELLVSKMPLFFVVPLPSYIAQMNLDLPSLHVHSGKYKKKIIYLSDIKFTLKMWIADMQSTSTDWVYFWKKKRLLNIYREINFYLVRECTVWGWGK